MITIEEKHWLTTTQCKDFQTSYKNWIQQMYSRTFAELAIRKGPIGLRFEIINQMSNSRIIIPKIVQNLLIKQYPNDISNCIEEFFVEREITTSEQFEKLNKKLLYYEFINFTKKNFGKKYQPFCNI